MKILIADDHDLLRDTLVAFLENESDIQTASASTLDEALEAIDRDDSFDLVCGSGILHHLDLPAAMRELARVLRPSGRAVFMEPLGHNPAINAFRNRTPELRTPDEHPLLGKDLKLCRRYFGSVEVKL